MVSKYIENNYDENMFESLKEFANKNRCCASIIDKNEKYNDLKKWINDKVLKLLDPVYNLSTKINWIFNNRYDFPVCANPNCSNNIGIRKNIGVFSKYKSYCCMSCSTSDPLVLSKVKRTCLEKYENAHYRNSIKAKETCKTRYNGQGFASKELRLKGIDTFKKEHNISELDIVNIGQIEEVKDKIRQKVGNKSTNPELWQKHTEKLQRTCLEKYGVRSYSQTNEFAKKIHHSSELNNIKFDSSWELKIAKFCIEHNIEFEYQPNNYFEYEYNGKIYHYFPDFKIHEKFYEVKGNQFIKEDGSWQNPWNHSDDKKQEARHQCCLANNVIILSSNELDQLDKFLF